MTFDEANTLWREGEMRLRAAEPAERVVLERVIDALVSALRRRLGGSFLRRELAELYEQEGTDWCLEVAIRTAPATPAAWDLATVANAAFARYAREASDYRAQTSRPPGLDVG